MDSLSQLNRHHQKEVNYGKGVTKSNKKNLSVSLISLCYGNHSVHLGWEKLVSCCWHQALIVHLKSMKIWNAAALFALFTPRASSDGKNTHRTSCPAGAAAIPEPGQNTPRKKNAENSVFFFFVYLSQNNVWEWPVFLAFLPSIHLHTPSRPASHNALLFMHYWVCLWHP